MDLDPGGPKTFGSYGSGSATLIRGTRSENYFASDFFTISLNKGITTAEQ
jgi:hypothetical protein